MIRICINAIFWGFEADIKIRLKLNSILGEISENVSTDINIK